MDAVEVSDPALPSVSSRAGRIIKATDRSTWVEGGEEKTGTIHAISILAPLLVPVNMTNDRYSIVIAPLATKVKAPRKRKNAAIMVRVLTSRGRISTHS